MQFYIRYGVLIILFCLLQTVIVFGQNAVNLPLTNEKQHYFTHKEIEVLEDSSVGGKLTLAQVQQLSAQFRPTDTQSPKSINPNIYYWYKIKIHHPAHTLSETWLLEFFDQTIDHIEAYVPLVNGHYNHILMGDNQPFSERLYHHKNFEIRLSDQLRGDQIYYFRIKSHQVADVIIVLRSFSWFVHYALDEYFIFGIFYGMIAVFSLYNFIMFMVMRQRQYLYYVLYILSVGLYQMCTDGIAYQFIWPNAMDWNQYAYGIPLYGVSIFALLFTLELLHVRAKSLNIYIFIWGIIILRTIFFVLCLFNPLWFGFKFIEFIPLLASFGTGLYLLWQGYSPATFFVGGYSFLLFGFIIKLLIAIYPDWLPFGALTHYSLSFCFVAEMVLLSFAIGDKVSILKRKKEKAQQRIIKQLTINEKLKDQLNNELEQQVKARTKELLEKTEIIENQNIALLDANKQLQEQSEEIARINELLKQDNKALLSDVHNEKQARVLSKIPDFEEFSRIYPDNETCFQFLEQLKWKNGYRCLKCGHGHYFQGHAPHSRRCAKCDYEESVTISTIFQNARIPLNKAFYITFLVYSTQGQISSHKLSELIGIRQSTCWSYSSRIKKIMQESGKKRHNDEGWVSLIFE